MPSFQSPEQKRITVGIVTYKRTPICLRTIELMLPLLRAEDEIVVVEQGGDGVARACEERWPGRVRCFSLEKPSTVRARNYLIQQAQGAIIVFTDDDVEPAPKLLEAHWSAYGDPKVGGVAGRIFCPTSDRSKSPKSVGTNWMEINFEASEPAEVRHARGCNMSFRRSALIEIGGFDTAYRPPFFFREDSDVGFRVCAVGYKMLYVPEAELFHLEAKTGGARGDMTKLESKLAVEIRAYKKNYAHYRDSLYFLFRHFRGQELRHWIWFTYRHNVGFSRYPWRLVAKNYFFFKALRQAWWESKTSRPPYFESSPEMKKPATIAGA